MVCCLLLSRYSIKLPILPNYYLKTIRNDGWPRLGSHHVLPSVALYPSAKRCVNAPIAWSSDYGRSFACLHMPILLFYTFVFYMPLICQFSRTCWWSDRFYVWSAASWTIMCSALSSVLVGDRERLGACSSVAIQGAARHVTLFGSSLCTNCCSWYSPGIGQRMWNVSTQHLL